VNNTCASTPPPQCTTDEQCATDQTCVDGTCRPLACECATPQNHQCVAFECGPGCAQCPEGQTCGEDHTCHAAAGSADLAVSWAPPGTVFAGQTLTFALTVTNHGPDAATTVVVHLTFPSAPTSLPSGCTGEGTAVTCTVGALGLGAQTVLMFPTTAVSGARSATAMVSADQSDADAENDTASVVATVPIFNPGQEGGGDSGCGGCSDPSSVAGPVPGGLVWGVMVMLLLRLGRRRR